MICFMFLINVIYSEMVPGALPAVFGTSHLTLVHRAHLRYGQVLLVLGAAVQIGKLCGTVVIAVVRGEEKV
ncbi:hypothetical protein GIB67_016295 [Kingdonia uniflora]|uniref:Uncharacterized protein n=1 Tax=Kingdonia uniflora TaxID=39325 RepID=A0A7J7M9C8_9MAGN|nr:hypothetical protein GIB67_016295 [Kingdonia uniflora]